MTPSSVKELIERLLFAELNYLRDKQSLCRQVRGKENDYDEQIELLLKAIDYLQMAIKKGERK